jgi:hypothetical protein
MAQNPIMTPTQAPVLAAAGSVFGRDVLSAVPLLFTRDGLAGPATTGTLRVDVTDTSAGPDDELLIGWERSAENPVRAAVFRDRNDHERFLVAIDDAGTFVVRPHSGDLMMPAGAADTVRREARLWSLPMVLCLVAQGELPLHAAALERNGRAVVVGGLSRFGKSTLAGAAVRAGWRLLSEDTTAVRLGGRPDVLPGPAGLRLRPDVAAGLPVEAASTWTMPDGRVQHALPDATRGSAAPVPLCAVVLLAWDSGPPRLERVPGAQAIRDLWSLTFRIPEAEDRLRCFDQLATLTNAIPTHRLHRPRDLDALGASLDLLAEVVDG